MLRNFHDASVEFGERKSDEWAILYQGDRENDVICHNDFAPNNLIFSDHGVPTAMIDFDLCGPGLYLRDLAYLTYWMVPLSFQLNGGMNSFSKHDLAIGSQRLKTIFQAYGTDDYIALLDMVLDVLNHKSDYQAAVKSIGGKAANAQVRGGQIAHWQKEAKAFEQMLPKLRANF